MDVFGLDFEDKDSEFMKAYYKSPEPEKVGAYLEHCLDNGVFSESNGCDLHCKWTGKYFFARVAQLDPNVLENYQSYYKKAGLRERLFVLDLFELFCDEQTKTFLERQKKSAMYEEEQTKIEKVLAIGGVGDFSAFEIEVDNPGALDFLWTEFFASGNPEAVSRVVDSLSLRENTDPNERLIAMAARWSLKNMSFEDEYVFAICKGLIEGTEGVKRRELNRIVSDVKILLSYEKQFDDTDRGKILPINQRREQNKKVEGAKAWALACGAVLNENNHGMHDHLATEKIDERNVQDQKKLLSEWWGVEDFNSLLENLNWVLQEGHSKRFDQFQLLLDIMPPENYAKLQDKLKDDPAKLFKMHVAENFGKEFRDCSLLGWDYSRAIMLCRWSYMVGYISEEEAWARIMFFANALQDIFDSWEDLGRNYIIGRQFWSMKHSQQGQDDIDDAFQRLIDMKDSPWNKYPWDMNLSDSAIVTAKEGQ